MRGKSTNSTTITGTPSSRGARGQRRRRAQRRPAHRHVGQHQRRQQAPHRHQHRHRPVASDCEYRKLRQHQEEAEEEDHQRVAPRAQFQRLQRHQHHQQRDAGLLAQQRAFGPQRQPAASQHQDGGDDPAVGQRPPRQASAARQPSRPSTRACTTAAGAAGAARWSSRSRQLEQGVAGVARQVGQAFAQGRDHPACSASRSSAARRCASPWPGGSSRAGQAQAQVQALAVGRSTQAARRDRRFSGSAPRCRLPVQPEFAGGGAGGFAADQFAAARDLLPHHLAHGVAAPPGAHAVEFAAVAPRREGRSSPGAAACGGSGGGGLFGPRPGQHAGGRAPHRPGAEQAEGEHRLHHQRGHGVPAAPRPARSSACTLACPARHVAPGRSAAPGVAVLKAQGQGVAFARRGCPAPPPAAPARRQTPGRGPQVQRQPAQVAVREVHRHQPAPASRKVSA
jgi:hypothetical protein